MRCWPPAAQHPEAEVLVHPECRPEVMIWPITSSDLGMVRHACDSLVRSSLSGTEVGPPPPGNKKCLERSLSSQRRQLRAI